MRDEGHDSLRAASRRFAQCDPTLARFVAELVALAVLAGDDYDAACERTLRTIRADPDLEARFLAGAAAAKRGGG